VQSAPRTAEEWGNRAYVSHARQFTAGGQPDARLSA
jgi:hypothetical protein